MTKKVLFFVEDFVPTAVETQRITELTEMLKGHAEVLVRTKDANTRYGMQLEDAIAVYNPPAEYAAVATITDSVAIAGALICAADKAELGVGDTTRLHVAHSIGPGLFFQQSDFTKFQLTDDTGDATGTKTEVVTSNAVLVSDTPAVATIASDGLITGVAAGSATITATFSGLSETWDVQVS